MAVLAAACATESGLSGAGLELTLEKHAPTEPVALLQPNRVRAAKTPVLAEGTAASKGLAPTQNAPQQGRGISPVLECIEPIDGSQFRAYFGYANRNATPVRIAVGTSNRFHPRGEDRGQPSVFQPGRHQRVFSEPFEANSTLVWTLRSPNGSRRTATAGTGGPRCSVDGHGEEGTCDLFGNGQGCGEAQTCDWNFGTASPFCRGIDEGKNEGEGCTKRDNCGDGLSCLGSGPDGFFCRRWCESDAACQVDDANAICRPALPFAGLCTQSCIPGTSTGCSDGATCGGFVLPEDYAAESTSYTECYQPGEGAEGDACVLPNDCQAGLQCFRDTQADTTQSTPATSASCYRLCRLDEPDACGPNTQCLRPTRPAVIDGMTWGTCAH